MSERVNEILCAANPQGSASAIERLLATAEEHGVQAVALVGNLGDQDGNSAVFRARSREGAGLLVPGPEDAPDLGQPPNRAGGGDCQPPRLGNPGAAPVREENWAAMRLTAWRRTGGWVRMKIH